MGPVNSSRRHDDRPPHRVPPDSRAVPLPALCARADPLSRYRQRSLAEPAIRGLRMHALRLRPFREIHALTTTLTHTWLRSLTRLRGPAVEDPWEGVVSTLRIRDELGFRPIYPSVSTARDAGA